MSTERTTSLQLPDLNALRRDQHSFLARVLEAGTDVDRLPPRFEETFGTFLRAQALVVAQRQRTGIALGREAMRLGLAQAYGCIELGLQVRIGEDVEAALAELAHTSLSDLHRHGYEEAFRRLHTMQAESALLTASEDARLCTDLQENLRSWCNLTPETWVLRLSDGATEPVDPSQTYREFTTTRSRLQFIRSFPMAVRRDLRSEGTTTYPDLLRRVIVALSLGQEDLGLNARQIEAARQQAFHPPSADAELRKELQRQLEPHLHALFEDHEDRVIVHQDVRDTLACLVEASHDATTFLLTVDERLADGEFVVDDPVAAALAAAEDLRTSDPLARQP